MATLVDIPGGTVSPKVEVATEKIISDSISSKTNLLPVNTTYLLYLPVFSVITVFCNDTSLMRFGSDLNPPGGTVNIPLVLFLSFGILSPFSQH